MASTANEEAPIVPEPGPRSDEEKREEKLSSFGVFAHLMKASLGTGILAMPMAIRNAGYIVGPGAFIIIGLACTYCTHLLVKSSRILRERKGVQTLEYADTAAAAVETSSIAWVKRIPASIPRVVTELFLVVYMIGACSVYVLFVKENLKQLFDVSCEENEWSSMQYLVHVALALTVLVVLPDLQTLAGVSFIADAAMVFGVGMCFISFHQMSGDKAPQLEYNRTLDTWANVAVHNVTIEAWVGWSRLPLFFGTAIFALEGIGLVLTMENQMEDSSKFLGWWGILNKAMLSLFILYWFMGLFGYLVFGEKTKGSITLNLPPDSDFAFWVRKLVTMGILLTYPVQFYVPERIIWKWLGAAAEASLCAGSWRLLKVCVEWSGSSAVIRFIFKQLLMVATVALPLAVPRLGPAIALIGAVCLSMLGLIFPTIIYMITNWEEIWQNIRQWKVFLFIVHIATVVIGLIGLVTGAYTSIQEMRELHAATE